MSHSVLNEPNKPQISTQEGERETLRVVSCQRGLAERDMTLNIPACECQIHLCLSDREREKERKRGSLFLFRENKNLTRNRSKCVLMPLKKTNWFFKNKTSFEMQEAIRVNQLKQSGKKT